MTTNTKQVKELVELLTKNNLDELLIEDKDLKIHLKRNGEPKVIAAPAPVVAAPVAPAVTQTQAAPVAAPVAEVADESKMLKSPMVGTFYTKPGPDADVFVKVGDKVKVGQEICIIEAMKTMNRIESDRNGIIKQILLEDGQGVEFDEPLFIIE
ncbi:MAG TPA: acetyl-CoA carboxylase biotin carboxyl carrier protein [Alphaproteobacteria bacterium]|nr:acetyl-CoA carboxylase biotin carboxyl carrier protein [Alphaproteobacteria bacterium]